MKRVRLLLRVVTVVIAVLAVLALASACSSADTGSQDTGSPAATSTPDATADPAVALIESKCSMCHSTERVWSADKTRDEWVMTVDRMKTNGLAVTDAEYNQIVDYLSNP